MTEDRELIIYSKDLSEKELYGFKRQYEKIPSNWLRRFKKDGWQLVFTTNIKNNERENTILLSDPNEKRLWINAKIASYYDYPVYQAFLYYIETEYGDLSDNDYFRTICNSEKDLLSKILKQDLIGVLPKEIFNSLFVKIIEAPQNRMYNTSKTCEYVKECINETIFRIRTSIIPDFLQVGTDVAEYQLWKILKAWEIIPQGLKNIFLNNNWRIILTNSREWRTDEKGRREAGYITTAEKIIFIKSSQKDIDRILYHEFGHFMYVLTNDRGLKKDIYKAYLKERDIYLKFFQDAYGVSNEEEFFAQVFSYYLIKPESIKDILKMSFNIINKLAQRYK